MSALTQADGYADAQAAYLNSTQKSPLLLDELFEQISAWNDATFPGTTANSCVEHLRRECVEFINDLLPTDACDLPAWRARRAEELADIFHLWVAACNRAGLDITAAAAEVEEKFLKNQKRVWKAPDAQGVVEHVEGICD